MPFWLACVLLLAAAAGIVCFARASSMNRPVRIVLLVLLSVMATLLLAYIALTLLLVSSVR